MKKCLVKGAITPDFVAQVMQRHQAKANIGAHSIFMGQVRADRIHDKTVQAIEYSAYEDMAEIRLNQIREEALLRFGLTCLHVFHSTGTVKAGEISLFVMVSAPHRGATQQAIQFVVEQVKHTVPVWKKEVFEDGLYAWTENDHSKQP